MKSLRFVIVSALVLAAMLVTAHPAIAQQINVAYWGQSQINEDGNLRFRVDASASGIDWSACTACADATYLQLWAYIVGPKPSPTMTPIMIKSKAPYNAYGQPATVISGTSPRFKLARGTYTYYVLVRLIALDGTVLAESAQHLGGTVTLP